MAWVRLTILFFLYFFSITRLIKLFFESGCDGLRKKAAELWQTIVTLETEKYDLEERSKRQDYDVRSNVPFICFVFTYSCWYPNHDVETGRFLVETYNLIVGGLQ
jgi:hypothetical protein